MKVLISDALDKEGVDILRSFAEVDVKTGLKPEELISIIGEYDALVVRSQTQVTAEVIQAGKKLQVVGRAGVGVDNINVEEATHRGIAVVNAPTGNTISAAEHTIALMLALARHIPQANTSLKSGKWQRSSFTGIEVRNKTLGIIGLGNVGAEVARRARGLEMKTIGHDPFVSMEYARNLQVELVPIEQIFKESDFITLHIPLTESTKGIIGEKELVMVKPGVRIINTARGGLVDEEALVKAIKEKRVAGAAIDVFTTEPITKSVLFEEPNIIVTPHLGASTTEAQLLVAKDIAEQVITVLKGQPPRYAVNVAFIPAEILEVLSPFIKAASVAGRLVGQLSEGQMSSIQIKYEGEISAYDSSILRASILGGLLEGVTEEKVNLVNASIMAARRGLNVVEQKEAVCGNYGNLISVQATSTAGKTTIAVTVMQEQTHIVRVNDYWIDIIPTGGYFMFANHLDRPGMIGAVGIIAGDANINISAMHVGRLKPRGRAVMILTIDEPLPEAQRRKILDIPDVYSVKVVKM
ncbi:MAG: phosphoglycerate dehydrogenase [Chloroflexota bacterium]